MGLLRLALFGQPEAFHDENRLTFSLRKAQALLFYLAVEGGMHSRSKLAAFFWPDSTSHDARTTLRNAIVLLRSLLADTEGQNPHLLREGELLGLNTQTLLELDFMVVRRAYTDAQNLSFETPRRALLTHVQHALSLVRGPFLDGFWLGEDAPFDAWHEHQRQHWDVCLLFLLDRLSSWYHEAGVLERGDGPLQHWLALDPLSEEASRRLMQAHLLLGEMSTALQVYTTSGAEAIIAHLEKNYDAMLGHWFEKGVDLSGGEWQKIALARAFMRDAPILILDEPTSALDAKAEYDIFQRFRNLTTGRTVLFISHRFSTVRLADRIFVLADAQIIENGSHKELLERSGTYAELFHWQAEAYR